MTASYNALPRQAGWSERGYLTTLGHCRAQASSLSFYSSRENSLLLILAVCWVQSSCKNVMKPFICTCSHLAMERYNEMEKAQGWMCLGIPNSDSRFTLWGITRHLGCTPPVPRAGSPCAGVVSHPYGSPHRLGTFSWKNFPDFMPPSCNSQFTFAHSYVYLFKLLHAASTRLFNTFCQNFPIWKAYYSWDEN